MNRFTLILFLGFGSVSLADSEAVRPISAVYSGFTAAQQAKIEQALKIVSERMLSPRVYQCAKNNAKTFYSERCFYRAKSSSEYFHMTEMQLYALFRQGMPRARIQAFSPEMANEKFVGYAPIGDILQVRCEGGGVHTVKGEFQVSLNQREIEKYKTYQDYEMLAGTIAHEFLHNLCHSHTNGPNAYTDDNFITVFGDCLQYDGKYVSRNSTLLQLVDPGSSTASGGKVAKVQTEGDSLVVSPDMRLEVSARETAQPLVLTKKMRIVAVTGNWTVDQKNYPPVSPLEGHKDSALEQYADYKLQKQDTSGNGWPFGLVLMKVRGQWNRIYAGTVLEPEVYEFQINDTALSDNSGSIILDFKEE